MHNGLDVEVVVAILQAGTRLANLQAENPQEKRQNISLGPLSNP